MMAASRWALVAHRDHAIAEETDFFPSAPYTGRVAGELIRKFDPQARSCWECACGALHLAHGLRDYFPIVYATDAYAYDGNAIYDFLGDQAPPVEADWIVSNPPFSDGRAEAFIRRAWPLARRGVAMLMTVGALRSIGRYSLLYRDCPLTVFAPFSERVPLFRGRWEPDGSTAAFYAWYFFLKPVLRPRRFMARFDGQYFPATIPIEPGAEARLTKPDDARLFGAIDRSKVA